VRSYGALGDGRHNDTPAINAAIAAASRRDGVVEFPPGVYLAGGSIHLRSDVTLDLQAGSTILAGRYGYDPPEPNPYAIYQDPGHSHFHDAVIWGESLTNVALVGSGTIDGRGNLLTGEPIAGRADKLLAIARCHDLTISGITIRRGGHFAIDTDDCTDVRSDDLRILTAKDRDGWNVINSQDVRITHLIDHAYDDALVFKSEWALGETLPSGDVTVTDAELSSVCCNGLMFGSETCGSFSDYHLSHIDISEAGKSGLGMVTMDGGRISDVSYSDITMARTAGPIMEKVGIRRRCGGTPGIGSIEDIRYRDITDSSLGRFSATLWGEGGHPIRNVSFEGLHVIVPGGGPAVSLAPPSNDPYLYNPDVIGRRPAYGFYLHDVSGIDFRDSSFSSEEGETRPAIVVNDGRAVDFDHVTAESSWGSPFELVLQDVDGYQVTDGLTLRGAPLAVSTSCGLAGPSLACFSLPPWFTPPFAGVSVGEEGRLEL
jgi:hypothetical protein